MLLVRGQSRKKVSLFKTERKLSNVMKSETLEFLVLISPKKTLLRLLIELTKKNDKPEVFCKLQESTG